MREDWEEIIYKDAVYKISTSKQKLKQKQYLKSGLIPIVDQGQDLIGGYTNDENRVIECDLPVLVFGDHTKITKLIDFKFAPGADGTKILEPSKFVLPEYLSILTKVLTFKIKDNGYARHYQHIEKELLPLAPLTIQRAIVSKIEALFSDLDNGIANFKKAQEQLKVYRQAVLKKAFEGELTKDWRAKQTNLPTAEELLKQIKEERQNHYNQQVEDWKKAVKEWEKNGKKEKKPKKPSALTIPEKPNAEHISRKWELPENWTWTQIGEVCFVTKLAGFEYTDYVKYEADGDLAVIKAENAGLNGFKKTDYSKIKSETVKMLTRSMIYGGELLVVFVGAGTGNVATVPHNKRFFLGPNIGMARPYFDVNTRFLELFLQSPKGKHMLMATAKAVAQPSLSMGTIRQTPFAFCSLEEQTQIVQEIESRLSVCDKMEQSITESILKAEALRQSILKKAFEGKLLSEAEIEQCKKEADYEPASELLKKIQAEKLAKEQEKKKKPTVKKKSKK